MKRVLALLISISDVVVAGVVGMFGVMLVIYGINLLDLTPVAEWRYAVVGAALIFIAMRFAHYLDKKNSP